MRKILLILCTLFFAMVFISCNNEDKNIPSKPTETDWEEIEESCTETISGVEEFDFSVGEWEYYQYGEYETKRTGEEVKGTEISKQKILIKETEGEKKVCYSDWNYETRITFFPPEYYIEMKTYYENEYVPDGDNTVLVKLEFLDEACTIFLVEEDSAYTEEETYADFLDQFSMFNGKSEFFINEDKSVLMLKAYNEFESERGDHNILKVKRIFIRK